MFAVENPAAIARRFAFAPRVREASIVHATDGALPIDLRRKLTSNPFAKSLGLLSRHVRDGQLIVHRIELVGRRPLARSILPTRARLIFAHRLKKLLILSVRRFVDGNVKRMIEFYGSFAELAWPALVGWHTKFIGTCFDQ